MIIKCFVVFYKTEKKKIEMERLEEKIVKLIECYKDEAVLWKIKMTEAQRQNEWCIEQDVK